MTKQLDGRKAFITGASKGIGKAIAHSFAEQGAEVHLNARNKNDLEALAEEIRGRHNCKAYVYPCDISNPEDVKQAFVNYRATNRQLDILVNNAGIMQNSLLGMVLPEHILQTFSTNVFGSVYCAQLASRFMMRQRSGVILNIGSIVGEEGRSGQSVYGASKSAITGFTKSLAKELAGFDIRVNAISPGMIETELLEGLAENKRLEAISNIALGRIGSANEVAQVALFLVSDAASYITGQVIGVDGGMAF